MPVIATLPDLSKMISVTWVNEIDISKIKTGQKVTLGIDAFPEKKMEGEVFALANIGQLLPKSDAKVFEVKIRLFGSDPDLRPAMTTSNVIRTGTYSNEVYIPSDAIFNDDSLNYVFIWDKTSYRQIVEPGPENENYTIIRQGLQPGDRIHLTPPVHGKELPVKGMEIYNQIKKKKEEKATADQPAPSGTGTTGPDQAGAVPNHMDH
jgi:multidrug efflux pump subunit AcrA (membrane-fusion protein)